MNATVRKARQLVAKAARAIDRARRREALDRARIKALLAMIHGAGLN